MMSQPQQIMSKMPVPSFSGKGVESFLYSVHLYGSQEGLISSYSVMEIIALSVLLMSFGALGIS